MDVYVSIAVIGIIATSIMTLFLGILRKIGWADVDMISAIGTLFTQNLRKAFPIGLAVHFIFGIVFAFIYLWLAAYFGFHSSSDFLLYGTMIGFAHGVVVSIMLVVLIAEHHPLPRYRQSGFSVVAAHAFAHLIYGFTVGFAAALISLDLTRIYPQ